MNPHADDLTEQRLARELRAAARHVELEPGSELAVVTAGRRRRHRRQQMTAVAAVVAVGGGTALAVQQLATGDDGAITTDTSENPDSTTPESMPVVSVVTDPNAIASSIPGTTPPGTEPPAAGGIVEAPPAEIVESNVIWTVVEPDSTEAVAYGETPTPAAVPGVMLATAPGKSNDYVPQFWRTDDAVNWTPIDVELPFGMRSNARFDGDTVYAVGTAPGIAKTDPNPMRVGVSHDLGVTWDEVELPLDTNDGRELPFVGGVSAYGSIYPIDGGALVWIWPNAMLDYQAISDVIGVDLTDGLAASAGPEGVQVRVDPACEPAPVPTVAVYGNVVATTAPPDFAGVPASGECETRLVSWAEIGVPDETVARVFHPQPRAFRVVDGEATEIGLPDDVYPADTGEGGLPLLTSQDGSAWYRLEAGGEVVPIDGPSWGGYRLGSNATTTFVRRDWAQSANFGISLPAFGASLDGGPWQYADWSQIAGNGRWVMEMSSGVTSAGLVQLLQTHEDHIALAGGRSVSRDGYTITRPSIAAQPVITNDATGEQLDLTHLVVEQGSAIVTGADGAEVARFSEQELAPVLYDMGQSGPISYVVATSADGVHVAVESIADLLGVADSEISSVPRVSAAGDKTVIAVTMKERNAEGVPRQLVLIGTPRT